MYKLFLTLRYLRKRRIAYFAIAAVTLCVFMVLVVHCVMSGFLDTVRNSSRDLLGDVILEIGGMESFPYYDEFIAELKQEMGSRVVSATPVIINAGLIKALTQIDKDQTHMVYITGIRLDEYLETNRFAKSLYYNQWYPGTTSLDENRMPTWYPNEQHIAVLPDEYERALEEHLKSVEKSELGVEYRREPWGGFPGPGYFSRFYEEHLLSGITDTRSYTGRAEPGMILGIDIAAQRDPQTGEFIPRFPKGTLIRLTTLVPPREGSPPLDPGISEAFRYVDHSRTKIYNIDSQTVYCDFKRLQKLLDWDEKQYVTREGVSPGRTTQIQIKLAENVDYNVARDRIEALWRDFTERYEEIADRADYYRMKWVTVKTWEQRNADFIGAIEKERVLMLILFGLISMVAVVLVGCIFYMIVQEKTREIGIIKSLGASSLGVAGIYVCYGLAVGIVGSLLGTISGVFFVRYINEFQEFLIRIHPGLQVWSPASYSFDRIPATVDGLDVFVITVVAIVSSVLGSLIAAYKAAKVWPVDAIRYE